MPVSGAAIHLLIPVIADPGVLFKCGEPIQREVIGYIDSRENGDLIEYIMEAWTYDSGPARFHIIIFRGNRVYNIESEMK